MMLHVLNRQRKHTHRLSRPLGIIGVSFALVYALMASDWAQTPVYADSPAITDFGLDASVSAFRPASLRSSNALFLTLYDDGRHQVEVKQIQGDSVALFSNASPAWRLDGGLMWFMRMPVYVREVKSEVRPSEAL
jgi:hypothetical protein